MPTMQLGGYDSHPTPPKWCAEVSLWRSFSAPFREGGVARRDVEVR